jgi:lipopolysaccharide export system ATP-binding protein
MALLRVEEVSRTFGGVEALADVTFALYEGQIKALIGPNGAGKTTCFYMIAGLVPADGGRVHIEQHDVTLLPMHVRARHGLGYLAQEPSVFRRLTVAENILAVLETLEDVSPAQRRELCGELLREFSLDHLKDQRALSLSGGERRRLEIARALALEPRFILLDEPFAGVDPISVMDIQKIIGALAESGIGILITDHNVRETLKICGRAYIISAGRVLAEGPPAALLDNADVRAVYLGADFRL